MNHNHRSPQPTPQPLCAAFGPLLPLLSLNLLDAEETTAVRTHVATCAFCQRQIGDFDVLRDALRRDAAREREATPAMAAISFEAIMAAAAHEDGGVDAAGSVTPIASAQPRSPRPSAPAPVRAAGTHRARNRWATLGALAAVLLLAVLAATLFGRPGAQYGAIAIPGVGTLTEFAMPTSGSQPRVIIVGPDHNLWFTENGGIGRITPRGVITEFPLPGGITPTGLAVGPDGAIWYTDVDTGTGKIGRFSLRVGQATEFALPPGDAPTGPIVAGPDSALWFVVAQSGKTGSGAGASAIGRITPAGNVTTFPLAIAQPPIAHPPDDLALGPDGNLWFTTWGTGHDTIGRMSLSGAVTQFPTPDFNGEPARIVPGPDGNLWFLEGAGLIGRITPQGAITEFTPPGGPQQGLGDLAVGPDGNLWVPAGGYLGRITPAGTITAFTLPHGITFFGVALGPDHNLWFTSIASGTISRVELTR